MDVYQVLMQDHRIVEELFSEIEKSDDREVERREQLFARLRKEFEDHSVVEENIFYPSIEKLLGTKEFVEQSLEEHAGIEAILQEISEMRTNKGDWLEKINELKDVVQRHVHREENKMFPAARKELDESRAEELGRQILQMKQKARQKSSVVTLAHSSPKGPGSAIQCPLTKTALRARNITGTSEVGGCSLAPISTRFALALLGRKRPRSPASEPEPARVMGRHDAAAFFHPAGRR
jgi:hemerythrin superfamily protein